MPSPLTLPVRYTTRKPPLGVPLRRSHPALWSPGSQNVPAFVVPLNDGAGNYARDAARCRDATLTGGASWVPTAHGPGIQVAANGQYVDILAPPSYGAITSFTAWVWWRPALGNVNYSGILYSRGDSSGLLYSGAGGGQLGFVWHNSNEWDFASGLVMTPGRDAFCAMSVAPTGTTLFVNGQTATMNETTVAGFPETGNWRLGMDAYGVSRTSLGIYYACGAVYRSLSVPELRALAAAPFGMFG